MDSHLKKDNAIPWYVIKSHEAKQNLLDTLKNSEVPKIDPYAEAYFEDRVEKDVKRPFSKSQNFR